MPRPFRFLILLAILTLAACTSDTPAATPTQPAATVAEPSAAPAQTPAPQPTATPAPTATPSEAQITSRIQETLDRFAEAYNDNQANLLDQAIDQTNVPFRRFARSQFGDFQQSALARYGIAELQVESIAPREHGFVLAHISVGGRSAADWPFREVDGRWVISEPTVAQLGAPLTLASDHFTFDTYPWANDVNDALMRMMEQARSNVLARLGRAPEQKAQVFINPIYGLHPFESSFALAYYRPITDTDTITIYAPHSFAFGYYDANAGWEGELENVLTHEYTHLVQHRSFPDASNVSSWMEEGLAEFVAGNTHPNDLRAAVRAGAIIPIIDTASPAFKQDLEHLSALRQDRALAYGFAYSLVAFIVEKHGGLDGFWALARAYQNSQSLEKAVRGTFGTSYAQFDQEWRAWLEQKYG